MPSQIVRHHFWQSQNRLPELVRLFSQGGLTTSLNLFFCPFINFYPWPSSEQDVWTPWPADEAKCNEGVGLGDNCHWFAYPSSGFTDILRKTPCIPTDSSESPTHDPWNWRESFVGRYWKRQVYLSGTWKTNINVGSITPSSKLPICLSCHSPPPTFTTALCGHYIFAFISQLTADWIGMEVCHFRSPQNVL